MTFTFYAELAPGATTTATPNGWSWTDVTEHVGLPAISITRGRTDRYAEAQPDRCSLTFLNTGGRFVPRNPLSPYYGRLAPGTPLRILIRPNVNSVSDTFNRTTSSSWGSADVGGAWTNVTGGTAAEFSVAPASGGRHTHPSAAVNHWSYLASVSLQRVDITVRVRVNALSTGAAQTAAVVCRYVDASNSRRAEVQFATTGVLTARVVQRIAGADGVVASGVVAGLTHSTSAWYRIRLQTGLTSARMKVWVDGTAEPSSWVLDGASGAGFSSPVNGAVGVYSLREAGNTNASATVDFDDFAMVDGPRVQFTGFVDEWPVRWADHSLSQSYAPITASGQLDRIGRTPPLKSAIFAAVSSSPVVVAYWPMEDGNAATSFASGIGGAPSTYTGVQLAADSAMAGSDPLPTMSSTARIRFEIPSYVTSGIWAVPWSMRIPASSLSGAAQLMSWTTPYNTIVRWQLRLSPGAPDTVAIDGFAAGGGVVSSGAVNFVDASSGAELSDGRQLYFQVNGAQNGANIDLNWTCAYMADDGSGPTTVGGAFSTAGTTGRVALIYHDSVTGFAGGGHTIGHVALGDGDVSFGASLRGVSGGAGETTATRFSGLLLTQGVTAYFGDLVRGAGTTTQLMGAQRTGDILTQLREVAETELGVLYDGKQGFVHLLPRSMRSGRPVDLAVDVATAGQVGWPFDPTDDNAQLRNDVTLTNVGGSTARSTDPASIARSGVRPWPVQVNIYRGTDLQQHADWRKNLGITAGLRYPQIVINLTSSHVALASAWCDTDIGSRVQVLHVPAGELPPEDLDLVLDGYEETISSTEWTVRINASDGRQWLTAVLDASTPRLDCGASITSGTLTTTGTSVALTIADECTWTHADGDYGVFIGGELMTVTAVSAPAGAGTAWTQTLTVVRSVNGIVKTHAVGEAVHVATPIILAL